MKPFLCSGISWCIRVTDILSMLSFAPVLGIRLWISNVFFKSGLTKIQDWDKTVALFADEYRVPLLSPDLAATLATSVELVAPILVGMGLFARFGALSMLIMTGIIEFTYMHFDIHIVWTLMLSLILFQGAGKASLDAFIKRYLCRGCHMA